MVMERETQRNAEESWKRKKENDTGESVAGGVIQTESATPAPLVNQSADEPKEIWARSAWDPG